MISWEQAPQIPNGNPKIISTMFSSSRHTKRLPKCDGFTFLTFSKTAFRVVYRFFLHLDILKNVSFLVGTPDAKFRACRAHFFHSQF